MPSVRRITLQPSILGTSPESGSGQVKAGGYRPPKKQQSQKLPLQVITMDGMGIPTTTFRWTDGGYQMIWSSLWIHVPRIVALSAQSRPELTYVNLTMLHP